jgi:hypothetical protein
MASKYEKYVLRKATPPDPAVAWGRADLGIMAPYFFLSPRIKILRESNTMVEYVWVVKDSAFGVTNDRGPHRHDADEMFLFIGTDPENPDDLGAEVEFWMGEGKDLEKIKVTSTSLIFVPKGILHLPLFCKNVRRPFLHLVIALPNCKESIDDSLGRTERHPPRGV